MIVDELISLAGMAVLMIALGVVIAIVRRRRQRGLDGGQQHAGRSAQLGLVAVLLLVAGVVIVFTALATTDSRFRF